MSEQQKDPMGPKKYYEYYYTWSMAEAMRKKHKKNGKIVSNQPDLNNTKDSPKKWVIWWQKERDPRILPTGNARYYDK